MKTQIIKIIPCLVAGFILSACVGAVNIPSDVAEKKTGSDPVIKKTAVVIIDDKEPEPIVVDPEVALINRCTTKDLASDASCAPIVADHPCIRDPFGGACDITFTDYYKTAQANRISFCRESINDNLCVSAITTVCDEDPFDGLCGDNFRNPRNIIIDGCRTDETGNLCPQAISRTCSGNPFDSLCDDNFQIARANRVRFCSMADNASNDSCNTAVAEHPCIEDPFTEGCNLQTGFADYYQTSFNNRLAYCRDNTDPSFCMNAIATTCSATGNPFDPLCSDSQYQPIRTNRLIFCGVQRNVNDSICTNALLRPNAATWKQSEPNGFVQSPTTNSLNLSTATYKNKSLNGDSTNGVSFYKTTTRIQLARGSAYYSNYYAGILSSTDLGAPRTEKSGTAEWNGAIQIISGRVQGYRVGLSEDFTLTINFGAGDQAGTISAQISYYSLTGNFDSKGLITGNVIRSVNRSATQNAVITNGTLTGLIGQEGAVGVFVSDINKNGYSGGFVARPPAD